MKCRSTGAARSWFKSNLGSCSELLNREIDLIRGLYSMPGISLFILKNLNRYLIFLVFVSMALNINPAEAKAHQNKKIPDGMVLIPAGTFLMGEPAGLSQNYNECPQHEVYLGDFYIDKYLVTNRMFSKFVKKTGYITDAEKEHGPPLGASWRDPMGDGKGLKDRMGYPAIRISWNDAQAYCKWAGKRLPTEAEFEKAARGGIGTWHCQDDKREDANWYSYDWIHPVGIYGPNPYGVYDILGYVWEWCSDWYGEKYYEVSPKSNPQGPDSGTDRVLRGGACWPGTAASHTAARIHAEPHYREVSTGFRCAKTP